MNEARVVVFRPGALGDTIVTADALAALRARFPGRVVELVGNAPAAGLLQATGLVDVATPFDSLDVGRLFEHRPTVAAQWRDAELVVLWLPDADAIAEAFQAAGTKHLVTATPPLLTPTSGDGPHPASTASRRFVTPTSAVAAPPPSPSPARGEGRLPPPPLRGRAGVGGHELRQSSPRAFGPSPSDGAIHISDYLVQTLRAVGVKTVGPGPTLLELPTSARRSRADHFALLHPGSGSPSKNWPPDRFAEIARRLLDRGWSVRLLSGPADAEAVAAVRAALGSQQVPVEQPRDVAHLADTLASASLYLGNDSGVSHVSARLGVPTVAVFGPTDPRQWAPRGPRVAVVGGAGSWPPVNQVWDALLPLTEHVNEK